MTGSIVVASAANLIYLASTFISFPTEVEHPITDQFIQNQIKFVPVIPYENKTAYIQINKSKEILKTTNDPIWSVQLVVNGEIKKELKALIGRANKQTVNRHTAGNKSPLPVGTYSIQHSGIEMGPFPDPEVGRGYWIPITPLFATNRSALGIHQDPSWGKTNGESGTSGCIGLESVDDTKQIVQWIQQYKIKTLVVQS